MVDREAIRQQLEKAIQAALLQVVDLAQNTMNEYIENLEMYMGVTSPKLGWAPLHEGDTKFWYKTGTLREHLVSKITIEKNRIHVVAGVPHGAPGYQEALWNEFGWTPHGTSKVVRRPLFIPLAEEQLKELNALLQQKFSRLKLNIRIKI
jgi:hypothetical protein